jgi:hypothetical protein
MRLRQRQSEFLVREYVTDPRYGFRPHFHAVAQVAREADPDQSDTARDGQRRLASPERRLRAAWASHNPRHRTSAQ